MDRFRIERVTWGERALWAALVAVAVAPVALQPPPEEVARDYVAAVDRGDVEAALDLVTTDVVIRPVLGGYHYRREEAREILAWRTALGERWRIAAWKFDPGEEEVDAVVLIQNDAWRLVGPPTRVGIHLDLRGGNLAVESHRTGGKELERALRPFLAWAMRERPLELGRAWRNGRPVRSAEAAARLRALLLAWRAAGAPAGPEPVAGEPSAGEP